MTLDEVIEASREHLGDVVPVVRKALEGVCPMSINEYEAARARSTTWAVFVRQVQSLRGPCQTSGIEHAWHRQARVLTSQATRWQVEQAESETGVSSTGWEARPERWADYSGILFRIMREAGTLRFKPERDDRTEDQVEREKKTAQDFLGLILNGLSTRMRVGGQP